MAMKGTTMSTLHTLQLHVKGMSCQHCVKAVTQAVQAKDPQATLDIDLPSGQVSVHTALEAAAVIDAIGEEGYEARAVA